MAEVTLNQVYEELKEIKGEISHLRRHVADIDVVLSDDDLEAIKEAELDLKYGKTKRLN